MTTEERPEKFDYSSAAAQIARIESSKGRPATPREKAKAVAQANEFIKLTKQLEEASTKADKWYQEALDARADAQTKPDAKPVRARIEVTPRIFTDEAAAAARARLKAKGFGLSAGIDPSVAKARLRARFARVLGGIVCAALGLVRLLARRKGT